MKAAEQAALLDLSRLSGVPMRLPIPIVRYASLLLVIALCGSAAAEHKSLRKAVEPGGEVLVAHHKRYDKKCRPHSVPTVTITRPPAHGTVDVRDGTFVIDESWHPDAESSCRGISVPGRGIYYRADPKYRGSDTFEYEVILGIKRPIPYEVNVHIEVR